MTVGPETPLDSVLGGESAAGLSEALDIRTAGELLDHLPRRWVEYGRLSALAELREDEHVSFVARVHSSSKRKMQRRRGFLTEVVVEDDAGGTLQMAFFQGHRAHRELQRGTLATFHGKVGSYRGRLTLNNPQYAVLTQVTEDVGAAQEQAAAAGLYASLREGPTPLYPANARITSWQIESAVLTLLEVADLTRWPDPVPADLLLSEGADPLAEAYRLVHRPDTLEDTRRGLHSLRLHEAYLLNALIARRRAEAGVGQSTPRPTSRTGLLSAFDERIPFALTTGQREAGGLISDDLTAARPMNRLLQGEVGSGKTVVALRAMLQTVDAGGQAALIAPTEVLAAQHMRSLQGLLGGLVEGDLFTAAARDDDGSDLPTARLRLLTGSLSTADRREALLEIASGRADIVVGTHALLGEQVQFADLGLVVVDEQHRFGVEQRDALRRRGAPVPHMLVMSATPIPRSVAMTVFGDLELTVLEGLPDGRRPIETHVARMTHGPRVIGRVWERLAEEVAAGRQGYVVCPKISESDRREDPESGVAVEQDASVETLAARLAEHPLIGRLRLGTLHGRMEAAEKERVMTAFERGEIDVLISTTVVEVGVDVPNATFMAVLDADAFGMSTLHQLRGRIGRGSAASLCLLVTRLPDDHPSLERITEVAEHTDGMMLARLDLERRREGDVLGSSQAGARSSLRLLRVLRDEELILRTADHVRDLTDRDPRWEGHPELRAAVEAWTAERDHAGDFVTRG
ncbi:ATP-dependent DNA helicase RecG [Nesterenkonia marinintestina]|uniref:ATP-dependent DNA helicase RecG n=1 Tax=Nesterenkonia marinintestina TaxID=2979865 RepID=UPI0021C12EB1|nr:ATP-dependent DNA helicase RecG [Nesterenkonia sp. GX14115]